MCCEVKMLEGFCFYIHEVIKDFRHLKIRYNNNNNNNNNNKFISHVITDFKNVKSRYNMYLIRLHFVITRFNYGNEDPFTNYYYLFIKTNSLPQPAF